MKKLLAVALVLCMIFSFAACGGDKPTEEGYNELNAAIGAESVIATNARVVTDSNGAKMLVTDIQNNGDSTVSEIVVCFAAWNAEGAPMAIKTARNPENEIFDTYYNQLFYLPLKLLLHLLLDIHLYQLILEFSLYYQ